METPPSPPPDVPVGAPSERDRRADFIFKLLNLASSENPQQTNRKALAELRGILRGSPADYYRASRWVTPFLGETEGRDDKWFYLVGALLALHPQHAKGVSLGKAMNALKGDSGSMDSRVLMLLDRPGDDLDKPLRQIIGLLEAKGVGLDYLRLLRDLCAWDYDEKPVQRQWARDYFRTSPTANNTNPTDNPDNGESE